MSEKRIRRKKDIGSDFMTGDSPAKRHKEISPEQVPEPSKGRKTGAKNYIKELLYSIIKEIEPSSTEHWKLVGNQYQELSGEDAPRDPDCLRTYFIEKMCNKWKKVTGESAPQLFVAKCQHLQRFLFLTFFVCLLIYYFFNQES